MKIGYIDYLNCYPFYFHMFAKQALEEVNIVSGKPNFLNQLVSIGELDMEIRTARKDEIGDLSEAIARMQDSIRISIERLRRRLLQRVLCCFIASDS